MSLSRSGRPNETAAPHGGGEGWAAEDIFAAKWGFGLKDVVFLPGAPGFCWVGYENLEDVQEVRFLLGFDGFQVLLIVSTVRIPKEDWTIPPLADHSFYMEPVRDRYFPQASAQPHFEIDEVETPATFAATPSLFFVNDPCGIKKNFYNF